MKTIEHLPHTADVRIRVVADSVEELFSAALGAMNGILKRDGPVLNHNATIEKTLSIQAQDQTALLIDFLNEVLSLSYTSKAIFSGFFPEVMTERSLVCLVTGRKVPCFDEDIKAVTYNEADIRRDARDRLETVLVFDI